MSVNDQAAIERTGKDFDEGKILEARRLTWEAVELIASRIRPGMKEEEGVNVATAALAELGTTKLWHKSLVRFGANTLHPYSVASDPKVTLAENDIFFVDIGPVFHGYEGDSGATYVVGNDGEMKRAAEDCKKLFDLVKTKWREENASGIALYEYADAQAQLLGWKFFTDTDGHRLSDFPHKIHYKGAIGDLDFTPTSSRWVLEIQIRHPKRPFGAFYEDLLV